MPLELGSISRRMFIVSFVILAALLLSACSPNPNKGSIVCDDIVQPVCSTTNQTYSSICALWRDNMSFSQYGVCYPDDVSRWNIQDPDLLAVVKECGTNVRLMCGVDQHTYLNGCYFNKAGVRLNYMGDCRLKSDLIKNTPCENKLDFVCGSDNRTYQNECLAKAYGAEVVSPGRCKSAVRLKCDVNPYLCSKDGVTYENECVMLENGGKMAYEGMCKPE